MLFAHVCENLRTDPQNPAVIFQLGAAAQLRANIQTLMTVSTSPQPVTRTVVSPPERATAPGVLQLVQRKLVKTSEEGQARP